MVTTRRGAETTPASSPSAVKSTRSSAPLSITPRTPPYLPTPLERIGFAIFPLLLVFGTLFSLISPETRSAVYDPVAQAHVQDPAFAPSYFARKSNLFNVIFVKRGWGWITLAFAFFALTHPALAPGARRVQAGVRWGLVTAWWFLVTQWFFGPAIIDRGFRWTGGKCEIAEREIAMGDTSVGEFVTSVACKAAGGKWKGGHDISGHVFLLVLGSAFLMQEVGWPVLRWAGARREERCVVMPDGAIKSAGVEAVVPTGGGAGQSSLGAGGKAASAALALSLWMLLMTAIYFHTWFEKLTGLLTATIAVYTVYFLPRLVPAVRQVVGLPGV